MTANLDANSRAISTVFFTVIALLAFAGNSVLCRLALADKSIDANSFTLIRLLCAAAVLLVLERLRKGKVDVRRRGGSGKAAAMLFLYALCFSLAYISLDTGTGALILFAVVQITMIGLGLSSGHKLGGLEWLGTALACCGLAFFLLPGASAPSPLGFALMALAGFGWGYYSTLGRGSQRPLTDTCWNFVYTLPLALLLLIPILIFGARLSPSGIALAAISGALTSGIGYAIWYRALAGLSPPQASVLQLSVPIIAAVGGILFAGETLGWRLIVASLTIIGGICLVIYGRR